MKEIITNEFIQYKSGFLDGEYEILIAYKLGKIITLNQKEGQELNFLEDIGLSTVKTLLAARTIPVNKTIIAAGGITNALDIFKSLVLGAQYVGIANYFLQFASQDSKTLIAAIQNLKYELKLLTALFGLDHISKADEVKYYLDTDLYNFTRQLYN